MDAASLAGGEQALHDQKLHGLTRGDPCHAENLGHLEQIGQLYAQRQHAVFDLLAQHVRQLGGPGRRNCGGSEKTGKGCRFCSIMTFLCRGRCHTPGRWENGNKSISRLKRSEAAPGAAWVNTRETYAAWLGRTFCGNPKCDRFRLSPQ